MKNYPNYFFLTLFLIGSSFVNAQHPNSPKDFNSNKMFWFNGVINGKISGKWNYQLDVEYRRQADPAHGYKIGDKVGGSKWNILKNPYQDALRPWIHYQPNEKIRLSLSPITWFGSWSFPVNGKTTYQPEYRWSPQVTLYHKYGKVQFQQRYRIEFRYYGIKTPDNNISDPTGPSSSYSFLDAGKQTRFRYMLRAIIPLNSEKLEKGTHYIMTSDEIFIKWGKSVSPVNIFDQNRFYLCYGFKFHEDIRFEIGYLSQVAYRMNNGYGVGYSAPSPSNPSGTKGIGNNIDLNNNLFFSIIFDNFNNFFKKKEKTEN